MTKESEMPVSRTDRCRCPKCLQGIDHLDGNYRRELLAFLDTLNHEQRRLYAAVEANRIGRGGASSISEITGLCAHTIAFGRRQLAELLAEGRLPKRERKPVKGRPRKEEETPAIRAALEEMLSDEVAGSPEGEETWVRSSCRKLADRLKEKGFSLSHNTIWRTLKRMGFSMKTHVRKRRGVTSDPKQRDEQFLYMKTPRRTFLEAGWPVISVDTKNK